MAGAKPVIQMHKDNKWDENNGFLLYLRFMTRAEHASRWRNRSEKTEKTPEKETENCRSSSFK